MMSHKFLPLLSRTFTGCLSKRTKRQCEVRVKAQQGFLRFIDETESRNEIACNFFIFRTLRGSSCTEIEASLRAELINSWYHNPNRTEWSYLKPYYKPLNPAESSAVLNPGLDVMRI